MGSGLLGTVCVCYASLSSCEDGGYLVVSLFFFGVACYGGGGGIFGFLIILVVFL